MQITKKFPCLRNGPRGNCSPRTAPTRPPHPGLGPGGPRYHTPAATSSQQGSLSTHCLKAAPVRPAPGPQGPANLFPSQPEARSDSFYAEVASPKLACSLHQHRKLFLPPVGLSPWADLLLHKVQVKTVTVTERAGDLAGSPRGQPQQSHQVCTADIPPPVPRGM